ncbi:MAG: SpoIIE family protein phosphatase [Candidatus Eiseniibacteriota bacterium]
MPAPAAGSGSGTASATEARPREACAWQEGESPHLCRFRGLTEFFVSTLELDELIQAAAAFVHGLVRAESVRLWLLRRGGQRLVVREFDPAAPDGISETIISADEGLPGLAVTGRRSINVGPSIDDPRFRDASPPFSSALLVPLVRRGACLGVIECRNKAGGERFSAADQSALESVSEDMAVAIENAQLYFDTRRKSLERAVLLEVGRAIALPLSLPQVLEAIMDQLRRIVHYDAAAIYLLDRETHQVVAEASRGYPPELDAAFKLLEGEGVVGWVAKTGESVIVPDARKDRRYVTARPSTFSEMACPIVSQGRIIGVFNLENDDLDAYHEGHLEFLKTFASQAAAAIERARLLDQALEARNLERELEIARGIQASFLPEKSPVFPGLDIAGLNISYREVGGDYYDFIPIVDNQIGLAIGDVSGKGVAAALLMAAFRASLLAEIRNHYAIRRILQKVNSLLYESTDPGKFVTAFYGVLDVKNKVFTFANAGHNPPLLLRASGEAEWLTEGGLALGVLSDAEYEERPVPVYVGDMLVLYTDGVTEASNTSGDQYGTRRLEDLVRSLRDRPAAEIVATLRERVEEFSEDHHLNDDLTVVVARLV